MRWAVCLPLTCNPPQLMCAFFMIKSWSSGPMQRRKTSSEPLLYSLLETNMYDLQCNRSSIASIVNPLGSTKPLVSTLIIYSTHQGAISTKNKVELGKSSLTPIGASPNMMRDKWSVRFLWVLPVQMATKKSNSNRITNQRTMRPVAQGLFTS